jgi:hypothetical protein
MYLKKDGNLTSLILDRDQVRSQQGLTSIPFGCSAAKIHFGDMCWMINGSIFHVFSYVEMLQTVPVLGLGARAMMPMM